MGDLRVIVLGANGAGKRFLDSLLLEDNGHVVEVGSWEDFTDGIDDADAAENGLLGNREGIKVLRASTDWIEHRDAHGLEKFEPLRNVEFVEVSGYDPVVASQSDVHELLQKVKAIIHAPFHSVADVLHPDHRPSAVIANLVSSPLTPLYTSLVFLLQSVPTSSDRLILNTLSTEIPIIVLPRLSSYAYHQSHHHQRLSSRDMEDDSLNARLSTFQPSSAIALRTGLFNSPETLALLRSEATDRFLKWREVEREVEGITAATQSRATVLATSQTVVMPGRGGAQRQHERQQTLTHNPLIGSAKLKRQPLPRWQREDLSPWDQARWEAKWESNLSVDVARRLREENLLANNNRTAPSPEEADLETTFHPAARKFTPPPPPPPSNLGTFRYPSPLEKEDSNMSNTTRGVPGSWSGGTGAGHLNRDESGYEYDPLHLPSLLMFSLSLLGPLQTKIGQTIMGLVEGAFGGSSRSVAAVAVMDAQEKGHGRLGHAGRRKHRQGHGQQVELGGGGGVSTGVKVAVVGGLSTFCVGVGVGMFLKS
ncbi:hypothetical protein BDN72DRAFT_857371 [Pluteus cervinus]|uniref:Uncharacterized protein n=1 Tax=Pluteus cervinus TaxID=181527 RepID=A0ACD3AW37_9AGAR|nr:hypothetical protein BDN72DRAFT_857371 [Pluteus cervinus]